MFVGVSVVKFYDIMIRDASRVSINIMNPIDSCFIAYDKINTAGGVNRNSSRIIVENRKMVGFQDGFKKIKIAFSCMIFCKRVNISITKDNSRLTVVKIIKKIGKGVEEISWQGCWWFIKGDDIN